MAQGREQITTYYDGNTGAAGVSSAEASDHHIAITSTTPGAVFKLEYQPPLSEGKWRDVATAVLAASGFDFDDANNTMTPQPGRAADAMHALGETYQALREENW